jgi:hypothetical protein
MKNEAILCVFCAGQTAKTYEDPILQGTWFVECNECSARGPDASSEKKAIEVWTSVEMKAWPIGGSCPKGFGNEAQEKARQSKH